MSRAVLSILRVAEGVYAQLVEKLEAIGILENEPNIRNKLARRKFTAVFLVQCLAVIGVGQSSDRNLIDRIVNLLENHDNR